MYESNKFMILPGYVMTFGVINVNGGVQFSVMKKAKGDLYLNLYKKGAVRPEIHLHLTEEYRRGSVYFVTVAKNPKYSEKDDRPISEILSDDYEYTYESEKGEFVDSFSAKINGRESYGCLDDGHARRVRGGFVLKDFNWEDDKNPDIPFDDMILYQLHVRGYTKDTSSGVPARMRGTFLGLAKKIPYIKDLGINAVLLLPCYDFDEIINEGIYGLPASLSSETGDLNDINRKLFDPERPVKLNFWGYGGTDTYYFAPKTAYAYDNVNAGEEFKSLIKDFHKAGIEVLMDIYFSPGMNVYLMTDALRSWVIQYHIDGFRVNDDVMPAVNLVSDPILSGVKILTTHWDAAVLYSSGAYKADDELAEYNEGFQYTARRFLKSDEGMVGQFAEAFRKNPDNNAVINYITSVNGFTMADLVSYDIKHNESNGEFNTDGTDYNYSWNCGIEGKSRKKNITQKRMTQIRNAFTMLLLAQGTPMILAGDEFLNSQEGNNNPYCHDDMVTWVRWGRSKNALKTLDFVKKMIRFRKDHPILHQKERLLQADTKGCGMPDMSMHGIEAWRPDYSNYSRMLGILLYGGYAVREDGSTDDSVYIIYNMYWEAKSFDLPFLPDNEEWHMYMETFSDSFYDIPERKVKKKTRKKAKDPLLEFRKAIVPPRSIVVFIGR
ncbi:MAG: alpha-amylase [Lachnospiraceae bacterium]|jgi:isoamylase|nr:alpha-amylase [Lachnospiraceae bacterium]MEE3460759.1 alpha-amylase [Lachnospiraceae bacterium]